jgi:transcriptional regulator with XRE-family HTH domain
MLMIDTSVAEKVDSLFKNFPKDEDGTEYSYREVEEGTGGAVTATTVWKLRTGRIQRPSYQVIEALCKFFGVPVTYFSSEEPRSDEYLKTLRLATRLRQGGVVDIALEAIDLDEAGKRDLLGMLRYIKTTQRYERERGSRAGRERDESGG